MSVLSNQKDTFNRLVKLTPRKIKKCVGFLLILLILLFNVGYAPDVYSFNVASTTSSQSASKSNQIVASGTPFKSLTNKVNVLGNPQETETKSDGSTGNLYAKQVNSQNPTAIKVQNPFRNQNSNSSGNVGSDYGSSSTTSNALVLDDLKGDAICENDLDLIDFESTMNQDQDISVSNPINNGLIDDSVTSEVYSTSDKNKGSFPIKNKAGYYSVGFSNKADMKLFQFSYKNANLIQSPMNPASVKGNVNKNTISYKEIYPNTDLRYTVEKLRLKEEIIVKKYTGKNDFSFQISVENAVYKVMPDSTIMFYDTVSNKPLFYIPKGFAVDSNGNRCDSVSYEFTQDGQLKVSVDPTWIQNAAYPIIIDPTINLFEAAFSRPSVAYKQDGTQVGNGVPRYELAKFNQGIKVEEGTTNLVVNPSFENNTVDWVLSPQATRSNTKAYSGLWSLAVSNPSFPQENDYVITGIKPSTTRFNPSIFE